MNDFLQSAAAKRKGFLQEVFSFLVATRKWWLAPIFVALLLFAVLIILGGTAAAPFIYTLF